MTLFQFGLIVISLLAFVAGQLLLKIAMAGGAEDAGHGRPMTARRKAVVFAVGIACMTVTFFVNIGLLQDLQLSYLFPFQGLCVIIVTLGASAFLNERITPPLLLGTLLVTAGVVLVSMS